MTDLTVHADMKTLRAATRAVGPAVGSRAVYDGRIHLTYKANRLTVEAGGHDAPLNLAYTVAVTSLSAKPWERTVKARVWRAALAAFPAGPVELVPVDGALNVRITEPREASRRVEQLEEITHQCWTRGPDGSRVASRQHVAAWAPQIDPTVGYTIEAIDFDETHTQAFRRLIRTIGTDDARPVLDVVYVTPTAARATDSYTLSQIDGEYLPAKSTPVVLPGPLVRQIPPSGSWIVEWWTSPHNTAQWAVAGIGSLVASINTGPYTSQPSPLRDESYSILADKPLKGQTIWTVERAVLADVVKMVTVKENGGPWVDRPLAPVGFWTDGGPEVHVRSAHRLGGVPPLAETVIDGKPLDPAWSGFHVNPMLLAQIITMHDDLTLTVVANPNSTDVKLNPVAIVTAGRSSIIMPVRMS